MVPTWAGPGLFSIGTTLAVVNLCVHILIQLAITTENQRDMQNCNIDTSIRFSNRPSQNALEVIVSSNTCPSKFLY